MDVVLCFILQNRIGQAVFCLPDPITDFDLLSENVLIHLFD